MAVSRNKPTLKFSQFAGLRTTDEDTEVGFEGFTKAENVDISRKLKVSRRKGAAQVYTGTIESAFIDENVFLFINGSSLSELHKDFTATTIRSDLTPGGELAAHRFGESIFYSNGYETGVYKVGQGNRTFGLERPGPVFLSRGEGELVAGRYQAAATFIRDDGQESGTGIAEVISLATDCSSVEYIVPISTDPSVVKVILYLSHKNGTTLYRAGEVDNGVGTFSFKGSLERLQEPARTQFLEKPPAFECIDYFASRMLYSKGPLLSYSIPFGYELVDPRTNFIPATANINMIAVVKAGVFLGTATEIWFLRGNRIEDVAMDRITDYGVVPGTRKYISGGLIGGVESEDIVPVWTSAQGICAGLPDGTVQNLTQKTVDIPSGVKGTAMFRHEDGQNHYVSILRS